MDGKTSFWELELISVRTEHKIVQERKEFQTIDGRTIAVQCQCML